MPVTVRGGDILFNDSTTQSTAGANPISTFTGSGSVGDVALLVCTQNAAFSSGATVSGSFLFRITAIDNNYVGNGGPADAVGVGGDLRNRTTAFNAMQRTYSPQTGTWRLLNAVRTFFVSDSYGSATSMQAALCIRIS